MIKKSLCLKLFLISLPLILLSCLTTAKVKIKVYHFSLDGEKCDKEVTAEDHKIIKEVIKAWEAFDYKKALFETFLPVRRGEEWDKLLPEPGTIGSLINDYACNGLFSPAVLLDGGLYCSWGKYRLRFTMKLGIIPFPEKYYLALGEVNGGKIRKIWKRRSPARELWELPVLPLPNEKGICFFGSERQFEIPIPILYILDIKRGKTILKLKLCSEDNFGGYIPDYPWDLRPFYKDGFIIYKASYEGAEYFQKKFNKDMPLVVIDLRSLGKR